jgi:ABC-type phosphate/phosphonate transport system substrate-binding protein
VRLVATPIHAAEGCEGPLYSSALIARRGEGDELLDFAGRRFAFNSEDSLSGYVAPRVALLEGGADANAFEWVETGSHRRSIRAVASAFADVAAIDAVCWALAGEYEEPSVAHLKVIGWTRKRPALPFVTASYRDAGWLSALRAAFDDALAARVTKPARAALRLSGVALLGETDYDPIAALTPAG